MSPNDYLQLTWTLKLENGASEIEKHITLRMAKIN